MYWLYKDYVLYNCAVRRYAVLADINIFEWRNKEEHLKGFRCCWWSVCLCSALHTQKDRKTEPFSIIFIFHSNYLNFGTYFSSWNFILYAPCRNTQHFHSLLEIWWETSFQLPITRDITDNLFSTEKGWN